MVKRFIIVVTVLAAAALALAYLFFFRSKDKIEIVGDEHATLEPLDGVFSPNSLSVELGAEIPTIPTDETILIGTSQGAVRVKNFYRNAYAVIERSDVVIKELDEYRFVYHARESSFDIVILKSPIKSSWEKAEKDFLGALLLNQDDACRLNVSVVVPFSVDESLGGRSYPLSFCQSEVQSY